MVCRCFRRADNHRADLEFHHALPKNRERKRKPVMGGWYDGVMDIDNCVKAVLDALNGE